MTIKLSIRILLVLIIIIFNGNVEGYNEDPRPSYPKPFWNYVHFLSEGPISVTFSILGELDPYNFGCRHIVTFLAHGVILDHVSTICDSPDHTMGIVAQGTTVRYFDIAMAFKKDSKTYVVIKRDQDGFCTRSEIRLHDWTNSLRASGKNIRTVMSMEACEDLDKKPLDPMRLISLWDASNLNEWMFRKTFPSMTYNIHGMLGLYSTQFVSEVSDRLALPPKCFRVLTLTLDGHPVTEFKLSCGPIEEITSTDTSLRIGNTLNILVQRNQNIFTYTIDMNLRNGICFRKVYVSQRFPDLGGHRVVSRLENVATLDKDDKDCQNLLGPENTDNKFNENNIGAIIGKLPPKEHIFEGKIFKAYEYTNRLRKYNVGKNMGIIVQTIKNYDSGKMFEAVTLLVKDVPIVTVPVDSALHEHIFMFDDQVLYGKYVRLNKLHATDAYQALIWLNDKTCERKLFRLHPANKKENAKVTETGSATVTGEDKECQLLLNSELP